MQQPQLKLGQNVDAVEQKCIKSTSKRP